MSENDQVRVDMAVYHLMAATQDIASLTETELKTLVKLEYEDIELTFQRLGGILCDLRSA